MAAESVVRELLARAGIEVGGSRPFDPQVHDDRLYARVLAERNLGLGEAYMDGWWDCPRLDQFFDRLLRSEVDRFVRGNLRYLLRSLPAVLFNLQSSRRAYHIAERHYDLGNELFLSFLDSNQQYSCAYFEGTDDLETAQRNKLRMIARKLELTPDDHLLDIGCGWGGLARYMAREVGCRVTGVNVSREQLAYALEQSEGLPIEYLRADYRQIEGRYDKIVSVGMFEHVGVKNYRTFMETVHRNLTADGIFLLHTIGSNRSRRSTDPWIARYIFPNSMLPSIPQISRAAEGLFVVEDWHNLGPHYDRTLMAWNERFQRAWPQLRTRYDERFHRMWEYYLLSCAGAFRARNIQLWQVAMTVEGAGRRQPRFLREPVTRAATSLRERSAAGSE